MEYNPKLDRKVKNSVDVIQRKVPYWINDCKEAPWDLKTPISTGMYFVEVDGFPFHFLLRDRFSTSDRVMISLTGGGYESKRINGPRFYRWKYAEYTNASVICIDDPMAYQHELRYGWFGGGTKECPMWKSLGELIRAIIGACGLNDPKIMFYSSSSGGTASILASSTIGIPCTVVAINPQINLPLASTYKSIRKNGLNRLLIDDDSYIASIVKEHQENRYLIMTNMASLRDYHGHFIYLCDVMSIIPRFGITETRNVINWVYYAPSPVSHKAMDWMTLYPIVEFIVSSFENGVKLPDNLLDAFTRIIGEHHEANKRLLIERAEEDPEIIKKATAFANSGDFDVLNAVIEKVGHRDLKSNSICSAISAYPERGSRCACSIMGRGLISADTRRAELIAPAVCSKAAGDDEEAQNAVMSVINSRKTKAGVIKIMADCLRTLSAKDSFFVCNALFDALWRLNTPESLAEMTSVANESASKGNAEAVARISKMYY